MGWNSTAAAIVCFVAIPAALWTLCAAFLPRPGFASRLFAYVAGSDGRLSLSRLQAFLWTLVIIGSYAAATLIHAPIVVGSPTRARLAAELARSADSVATLKRAQAVAATIDEGGDATRASAAALARAAADSAAARATRAARDAARYRWVAIPASLLALAGISLASGIFSSVIAASTSEEKTACVTNVRVVATADPDFATTYPGASTPASAYCLEIAGTGMSAPGTVRLDGRYVHTPFWRTDGTLVLVDWPAGKRPRQLIVDTPDGKLAYALVDVVQTANSAPLASVRGATNGAARATGIAQQAERDAVAGGMRRPPGPVPNAPAVVLGEAQYVYEFADLFRDDKKPTDFALMKFQMFGWTLIALTIYVVLFVQNLSDALTTLPDVDQSLVLLTGLSQAGYLGGKAVGGVRPG